MIKKSEGILGAVQEIANNFHKSQTPEGAGD